MSGLSCLNLPIGLSLSQMSSYLQSSSVNNGNNHQKAVTHDQKKGEILHSILTYPNMALLWISMTAYLFCCLHLSVASHCWMPVFLHACIEPSKNVPPRNWPSSSSIHGKFQKKSCRLSHIVSFISPFTPESQWTNRLEKTVQVLVNVSPKWSLSARI